MILIRETNFDSRLLGFSKFCLLAGKSPVVNDHARRMTSLFRSIHTSVNSS
jgi:hypothetical protein